MTKKATLQFVVLEKEALDNPFVRKMDDWMLKKKNIQLPKPKPQMPKVPHMPRMGIMSN